MMSIKIPVAQRDGLRALSAEIGKSITELVEMAITRVLEGETTLPTKDLGEKVPVSVYPAHEKEVAIKTLSKESGVSIDEMYRVAIRALLNDSQTMIDKAKTLALVQAEQTARKVKSSREMAKTLQDRRAALMAEDPTESEKDY